MRSVEPQPRLLASHRSGEWRLCWMTVACQGSAGRTLLVPAPISSFPVIGIPQGYLGVTDAQWSKYAASLRLN